MKKLRPQKQDAVEPESGFRHSGFSVSALLPLPTAGCLTDGFHTSQNPSKGLVTALDAMALPQHKPWGTC